MLLVVGAHSRNIGKTAVIAGLIRALPEARWTAVKLSRHGHGPIPGGRSYLLTFQAGADDTDSGRFLAAGAVRSYWLRTAGDDLSPAIPALLEVLTASENAILESSSILDYVQPDLCLAMVDFSVADLKKSSRRLLSRADAFLVVEGEPPAPPWREVPATLFERKPCFRIKPPEYLSGDLVEFVRKQLQPRRGKC